MILKSNTLRVPKEIAKMAEGTINVPLMTEEEILVPLLGAETDLGMMIGQPITTGSFFEGVAPIDYLQSRILAIVKMNPWLLGRFIKHKGKVVLKYNHLKDNIDIASLFSIINEKDIDKDQISFDSITWLSKFGIKSAINCVGKDEPIFKVTIIHIQQGKKYVLLVSLNHVIGDGHVFYKLYGMLDINAEIKSLKINREFEIHAKLTEIHGKDELAYFKSFGTLFNLIGGMLCGSKKNVIRHRIVDNNYINSIKKDFKSKKSAQNENDSVEFISTNDILSSCLYSASKCDVGLMAINFRNRFDGLTDVHVGNYEGVKAYHLEDLLKPELIRLSVNRNFTRPVSGNGRILPGFCRKYWAKNVLITNWSTLYEHVDLPDSTQVLHIPILKEEVVPFHGVFIIYRMNKNQLGICSFKGFGKNLDNDIICAGKPVDIVQEFKLYTV